ncbi:type II CRISPR RNA-guided endonuclease Cas9 [Acetobacteraceae bacterium]|nr:type II CRISPR RNA-guided endonuclease Cas9 [Acetobacteraceae bacterium]
MWAFAISKRKKEPLNRDILGKIGADLREKSQDELSPWALRVRGLDNILSGPELAVALGHIAKHRGFKSNAKNGGKEDSAIKKAYGKVADLIKENPEKYRTFAEVLIDHPKAQGRLRNRNGIYDCTPSRELLYDEVKLIFERQRALGSKIATKELEEKFCGFAFHQRPLQDSHELVGYCGLDRQKNPQNTEKRASMKAPSFEQFRMLTKLTHLEIQSVDKDGVITSRHLTPKELKEISQEAGQKNAKMSFKELRKIIGLEPELSFIGVPPAEEGKKDPLLSSNSTKGAFSGTHAFYKVLGEEEMEKLLQIERGLKILDDCAFILSFYETEKSMEKAFEEKKIPESISQKLLEEVAQGGFSDFTKSANLSARACRNLLPHLKQGLNYAEACAQVGYDHAEASRDSWDQILTHKDFVHLIKDFVESDDKIANPTARKALTKSLKQLWALRNKFGLPGKIAVELARDVGKSGEERGKIKKNLDDTTSQRKREREEAANLLGRSPEQISGETLLRYRLWKEQDGECLYSGRKINPGEFNDPKFEVDHILPWSRFGDDSYRNKTLALAFENQRKGNRTPKEYFERYKSPEDWDHFHIAVEKSRCQGIKKRNYLLINTKEKEGTFRSRNLNDTRYASRVFADCAELLYPKEKRAKQKGGNVRIFTRPGSLTAALRQGWGVEHLKKEKNPETGKKERLNDDRHHALDAICVACVTHDEINHLTKEFQQNEGKRGDERTLRTLSHHPLGWESFAQDVKDSLEKITVARPENRRARGQGHEETIRSFKRDEETQKLLTVSARKSLVGLKKAEVAKLLPRLKDPERNPHIIAALEKWMAEGCPANTLPIAPSGAEIRRIVVEENIKSGIEIKTESGKGLVSASSITRVDVFSHKKTSGKNKGQKEFFLVPVYSWQINRNILPMKACVQGKDEKDWILMDTEKGFSFEFSLYSGSYIKLIRKGQLIGGYYASFGRATAQIVLKNPNNPQETYDSIGVKNLPLFEKYTIDRFGTLSPIKKEVRQWHGKACT